MSRKKDTACSRRRRSSAVKRCGIWRQRCRDCSRTPWLVLGKVAGSLATSGVLGPPLRLSQSNSGYQNETAVLTCQAEVKEEHALTIQDAMNLGWCCRAVDVLPCTTGRD